MQVAVAALVAGLVARLPGFAQVHPDGFGVEDAGAAGVIVELLALRGYEYIELFRGCFCGVFLWGSFWPKNGHKPFKNRGFLHVFLLSCMLKGDSLLLPLFQ